MQRSRNFTLLFLTAIIAVLCVPAWADDTIYTKVDVNPIPLKTPQPVYPAAMRRQGVSGVVAVSIVVDEKGAVATSSVLKSSNPEFEEPALEAIQKWKFKPAKKDGNPVKMRLTVPLRFSIDEG